MTWSFSNPAPPEARHVRYLPWSGLYAYGEKYIATQWVEGAEQFMILIWYRSDTCLLEWEVYQWQPVRDSWEVLTCPRPLRTPLHAYITQTLLIPESL